MKILLTIFGVLIASGIIVGMLCFANHVRNQANIARVFSEQSEAAMRLQGKPQGRETTKQSRQQLLKVYAQALKAIDVSSCPKDFRLAWLEYIAAAKDLSDKMPERLS